VKPLSDLRVVEFATVGGVPFCGWWLAQQGAQITRIVNPRPPELGVPVDAAADIGTWGRDDLTLDLKTELGRAAALDAIAQADVLLEGFRPGVMERLGLGPLDCHARKPALIYARIVGWDRQGPWAQRAGHDINYIAMSGALHAIGPQCVPLNLIGDLAGGALYAASGILAALHARTSSGHGCVVDTAMTHGSLHLLTAVFARLGVNAWQDAPASNVIDGGVPWYRSYMTADGRHMAVGAIEERFYLNLVQGLELEPDALPPRHDKTRHDELADCFQQRFLTRSMAQWAEHFATLEACVTPVFSLREAQTEPVNLAAFGVRHSHETLSIPRTVPRFTAIS
jgi:alpha-methylacyl-CoA racemase